MATTEEIAALRLLIGESEQTPYSDDMLSDMIDAAAGNQYVAAYEVWTQKSAAVAGLVDVSEGGSTRKMGDLYEQYLSMAEQMRQRSLSPTQPPDGFGAGVRVRRAVRP